MWIFLELNTDPVKQKLEQYKQKWFNHVSRIEDIRYPQQLLDYQLHGKRRPGEVDTVMRLKQVIYWPNFMTTR
jgi:hypothetical protein